MKLYTIIQLYVAAVNPYVAKKRLLGQYVAGIFIKIKKSTVFRIELNHLPQAAPERFTPKKKSSPLGESKPTAPACRLRNVFLQRHLK